VAPVAHANGDRLVLRPLGVPAQQKTEAQQTRHRQNNPSHNKLLSLLLCK